MICYFAKKNMNGALNTITIGNDSSIHDECRLAKENINNIGFKSKIEKLMQILLNQCLRIYLIQSQNLLQIFQLYQLFLLLKLQRDITVGLTGDGGDELFLDTKDFGQLQKILGYGYPYPIKYLIYLFDKIFYQNSNLNGAGLYRYQNEAHFDMHNRFKTNMIHRIFPYLKGINYPSAYNNYDYPNTKNELELIQYMRHAEFYGMMQKTLRKVDQASMGNSLELRVPFLKEILYRGYIENRPIFKLWPK